MTASLSMLAVQNVAVLRALSTDLPDGGWPTIAALAAHLGRDKSNLSKTLSKLEEEGFVSFNPLVGGLTGNGAEQLAMIDRAEGRAPDPKSDEPGSPPATSEATGGVIFLRHEQIFPDHANARRDWDSDEARDELDALRADIIQNGLLQNLVVRADDFDGFIKVQNEAGASLPTYVLVGGERRWRAIGEAISDGDWEREALIPCRLLETDDLGHRLAALAENIQRRNLNPIEKAKAFEGLANAGLSNKEIADRISSTPEHVQQHRRLLQLDETDQQRMTLNKDDPRRLKLSDARLKLAKKDAGPTVITLDPLTRLALAEAAHASGCAGGMWRDAPVAYDAIESEAFKTLLDLGALRDCGIAQHGKHTGRQTIGRGHQWPYPQFDPPLSHDLYSDDVETRDAALAAEQQLAGIDDPSKVNYLTPWLADIGDLDDAGQALVTQREQEKSERDKAEQARTEQIKARNALWAAARARHIDILNAAQVAPTSGDLATVAAIAADIDRPLPWTLLPTATIVAANGATVKERPNHWGQPSDQDMALAQMIVVAANTAGGYATPAIRDPETEAEAEAEADDTDLDADDSDHDDDAYHFEGDA